MALYAATNQQITHLPLAARKAAYTGAEYDNNRFCLNGESGVACLRGRPSVSCAAHSPGGPVYASGSRAPKATNGRDGMGQQGLDAETLQMLLDTLATYAKKLLVFHLPIATPRLGSNSKKEFFSH